MAVSSGHGAGILSSPSHFYFKDSTGRMTSAPIIHRYTYRIVHPGGQIDSRIDPKLRRAATIAEERSNSRSRARCWQYVKEALVAAGAVDSYPRSAYAYEAGEELSTRFGFKKLPVRDPYSAPFWFMAAEVTLRSGRSMVSSAIIIRTPPASFRFSQFTEGFKLPVIIARAC